MSRNIYLWTIKKGISKTTDSSFNLSTSMPLRTFDYDNAALACSTTAAAPKAEASSGCCSSTPKDAAPKQGGCGCN